jgi:hypothetical protein
MATINKVDTTFSDKDIHDAASVYEYTADGTYRVRFQVQLTSLAGGGDVSIWLTLNDGDAVADNIIFPKTTVTLAAGAQSAWFVSGEIDVMTGDVMNVFALGLAGDTAVHGIVRVFSDDMTGVTGAVLAATQTGVTIPTVTAVTNGVSIAAAQTVATVTDVTNAVKISAGTGTGQLDFTSGVVKSNLAQILGTALTETGGLIAAAFKKFFNIATPTGTVNSLPDAVAGANGGLVTTNGTKVNQTVDLTGGQTIPTVTTVTNGVTLSDDAITSAKFDETSAFPVKKADATTTELARLDSAASYKATGFATPTNITAGTITTVTNLTNAPTDMALESTLTTIKGAGWTTETLKIIKDAITAIATWSSAAISKSYTAGAISDIRGSSWSIAMTGLTLDATKQQFVIKHKTTNQDADAILFVDSATGLITVNGVSTGLTAGDATLVYAGTTLTLTLKASVTALLPPGTWHYGIQYVTAAGLVEEPYGGDFTITADIVKATS